MLNKCKNLNALVQTSLTHSRDFSTENPYSKMFLTIIYFYLSNSFYIAKIRPRNLQIFFFFFFFFFFLGGGGGCKNENFHWKKNYIFLIFAQNIEAVLTSIHNVCFGSKMRKKGLPLQTPVFLYKIGI